MEEYDVDILPGEICEWLREDAQLPVPLLNVSISKHYSVETDFDRQEYGISAADEVALVNACGILELGPRGGGRGWTLQVRAEDSVGLTPSDKEDAYKDEDDMTLEEFETQFLQPMRGEVGIVVLADNEAGWERFQHWLARQRGDRSERGRGIAK
jgi:hypothetical protein